MKRESLWSSLDPVASESFWIWFQKIFSFRKFLDLIPKTFSTFAREILMWFIMQIVERQIYIKKLIDFQDKQVIKIVTGVRRSGKSTLLKLFAQHLRASGIEDNRIIELNFEDFDNIELCNPKNLHDYIKARMQPGKMIYLLLDEIQQVDQFQRVVDSFFAKGDVDIYLTGSNAKMLSSEIATLLSGRYVEIKMLPLSFKEYLTYYGKGADLIGQYNDYIRYGSFPYVLALDKNKALVNDYLESLYNTILLKDVLRRNSFADAMMLESVVRFVYDNIGNMVSTKSIADTMTSNGRKIDVKTVERYIQSVQESYFVYQAPRYDIKGKQLLKSLCKYYAVDTGMRQMLLGDRSYDRGRLLENIVYFELLRRYGKVYVGKYGQLEVDFVVETQEGLRYYQVSETVTDPNTLERELRPLQSIKDAYPKLLLTLDHDNPADYDGIQRRFVLDWLLD